MQVLVIGTGNRASNLMQAYQDNSDWGIRIMGALDPQEGSEIVSHLPESVPVLGDIKFKIINGCIYIVDEDGLQAIPNHDLWVAQIKELR